ncbi:MAG: hypothetical protein CMM25_03435 [Rhodospirillaceae bacterium]|nr:hypothetical protein [Rhodospirillaceae bacterium]
MGIGGNPSNIKKLNVTGTVSTTGTLTVGSNVFPSTDGTADNSLKTDGNGALSWSNPAGDHEVTTTHTVILSTNLSSNNQDTNDATTYYCWNASVDTADLKYTTGTSQGANSLFHIKSPGDYTINAVIWVSDATANDRAYFYVVVRFYTGQNNNTTRGSYEVEYSIGNAYIRDDANTYDCGFPGGTVTRYITQAQVNAGVQFEIMSKRLYSQDGSDDNPANQTLSKIRIEKTVIGLITLAAPSGLSYSGTPFTLSRDYAMNTLSPTVTANPAVSSWTVSPSLPNGVSINASTGNITGTPTTDQSAATYTITATNSKGNTTTTISITIEEKFTTSDRADLEVEFIANVNASVTQWLPAYYSTNNSNLSSNTTNSGDAIATTQWSYSSTNGYIQIGNHGLKVWAYANDGIMSTLDTTAGQAISFEAWIKVGNSSDWGPPSANNPRGWLMTYPTIWGPAITLNDSRVNDAGLGSGGGVGVVPGSATVNDSPPFALGLYGSSTFISNFGSSGTYSQSKNGWDHFVGYYENGGARGIYINGYHVAQDVHTTYPSFDASDGQLIIGNSNTTTSSDHNIKGIAVYGIRMWHKKLDQALVTKLFSEGHVGQVSPILAPTGLSYSGTPFTLAKNSAMNTLSPTVTGPVTSWTVSPSLPNGISINASTGYITGTPTAEQTATSYTITATNMAGNTTASISIIIEDASYSGTAAAHAYPFTTNTNDTVGSANLTINGSGWATFSSTNGLTAVMGSSASIAGNRHIWNTNGNLGLATGVPWTISYWTKGPVGWVWGGEAVGAYKSLHTYTATGRTRIGMWANDYDIQLSSSILNKHSAASEWIHYIWMYDRNNTNGWGSHRKRVFVNGTDMNTSLYSGGANVHSNWQGLTGTKWGFVSGARINGSWGTPNRTVHYKNLAIFNYALTPTQVTELYGLGEDSTPS